MARVLYWFRTDLRLHDSPALHAALSLHPTAFYPIWCWDPEYVYKHKVGTNRWNFLLESMQATSHAITSLNPTSKLHVLRGAPLTVLPILFKEWNITHLVYEKDDSGYGRARDIAVKVLAKSAGVLVLDILGHTLFDPSEVVRVNGGKPTMTAASLLAAAKKLPKPARPLPAPTFLPDPGDTILPSMYPQVAGDVDLNQHIRDGTVDCFNSLAGPLGDFSVPTLSSLGLLSISTTSIRGGELEALRRLSQYCSVPSRVSTFAKPKTSPAEFHVDATAETTLLSPYLKFGCLGVREFLWRVRDTIETWRESEEGKKLKSQETTQPENLEGQLIFREMYYAVEYAQGLSFGQIRGNSVCRYIDWHLPNAYDDNGAKILPRPLGDPIAEERFLKWKEGRTGFPWIDAIMRQLKQEGWIHHLARHSVACFLTRGQCYISWERGAEVFDEYLLDWDPCSNPGNWMWLSCSAFFTQYFRVYGVKSFPFKYDKTGKLVRKYCPELAKYPDQYIYSPHLAPLSVQQTAGCLIGADYPSPMLDDNVEKDACIRRIKVAYAAGLYGNDPKVLDGTAKEVLLEKLKQVEEAAPSSSGVKRKAVGARGKSVSKKSGAMDAFVVKKAKKT